MFYTSMACGREGYGQTVVDLLLLRSADARQSVDGMKGLALATTGYHDDCSVAARAGRGSSDIRGRPGLSVGLGLVRDEGTGVGV